MSLRNTAVTVLAVGLAICGILAGGAASSSAVSADAVTAATPQNSGLPAPYNKKPTIFGSWVAKPQSIHPRTTRSFYLYFSWQGTGKVVRVYLDKLPKGWRLLKLGTSPFRVMEGTPTWTGTNVHGTHSWPMRMHIGLSPSTPRGRAYYFLHMRANNGSLVQQLPIRDFLWMRK